MKKKRGPPPASIGTPDPPTLCRSWLSLQRRQLSSSGRRLELYGVGRAHWTPVGDTAGRLEPVIGCILENASTKVGCRTARTPKDAAAPVPGDAVLLQRAGGREAVGLAPTALSWVLGNAGGPPPTPARRRLLQSAAQRRALLLPSSGLSLSCGVYVGWQWEPEGAGGRCPRTWHLQDLGIWESGT